MSEIPDDIVERLRDNSGFTPEPGNRFSCAISRANEIVAVSRYAADEIERLRAERQRHAEVMEEVRKVLEPFSLVAERDIGDTEVNADIFRPMSAHNYAPLLTVGDLRAASALLARLEE